MTSNFFRVMQVAPEAGQLGLAAPDHVVYIGYGLWQRRFGSDPRIVGKTIQLNNVSYVVAGIAPARFQFPMRDADVWIPQDFSPTEAVQRNSRYLVTFGRIKRGVSFAQAQADMTVLAKAMAETYPEDGGVGVRLGTMRDYYSEFASTSVKLLFGAAGALLLMVCSNLANLLLVRGVARGREMAMRASLGAGRARVIRQLLTESALLAGLGAAAGVGISRFAFPILKRLIPERFPTGTQPVLDVTALGFAVAMAIVAGVLFGLGPAIQAARLDLNEVLKQSNTRTHGERGRARAFLVAGELALTVVLLVGGGLLLRSYANLRKVDVGFKASHLTLAVTALAPTQYPTPQKRVDFSRQVIENVKRVPGVISAGYVNLAPLTMRGGLAGVEIEGRPKPTATEGYRTAANIRTVSSGYLQTLGVPLLKGRMFDEQDTEKSPRVVVINETMARAFWPEDDAIGKRFRLPAPPNVPEQPWYTVTGVVGDIKQMGLDVPPNKEMYFPIAQTPYGAPLLWPQYLVVRTTAKTAAIAPMLRAAVAEVDHNQPVADIQTMDDMLDTETLTQRHADDAAWRLRGDRADSCGRGFVWGACVHGRAADVRNRTANGVGRAASRSRGGCREECAVARGCWYRDRIGRCLVVGARALIGVVRSESNGSADVWCCDQCTCSRRDACMFHPCTASGECRSRHCFAS